MTLSDKLLTQMSRLALNGQKLARISGVSDSEISRILAGKSRPGLENAFRLARALGVSLDYLADDALVADPAQPADPLVGDEREILELAHELGCARAARVLENIRIIGYEIAMRRLLDAKPMIEAESAPRPAAPVSAMPAGRANSA
jgi:transcriptional regulator with XRE-family HTH domain